MKKTFKITGMRCDHCRQRAQQAIAAVKGVTSANVQLSTGAATVEGDFSDEAVVEAVENAGYQAQPI